MNISYTNCYQPCKQLFKNQKKVNQFLPSETFEVSSAPVVFNAGQCIITSSIRQYLIQVSCAIEQYHIATQLLPDDLTELVPQYLSGDLIAPIDQEPLRYQTHGKNGYTLYSRGIDQQDSQGKPSKSVSLIHWYYCPTVGPTKSSASLLKSRAFLWFARN